MLARSLVADPHLECVALMAYDAQVAGLGDDVPGHPVRSRAVRAMQAGSLRELADRLPRVVAAVRDVVAEAGGSLELVNGGGTGSLARTAAVGAATELAAGSGLFAPTLFDSYRSLDLRPAALFALPVVRRPGPGVVTVMGGGYVASGPPGRDRLPTPVLPTGLRLTGTEGAGEVQTPLRGEPSPTASASASGCGSGTPRRRAVRAVRQCAAGLRRRGGGRGAHLPRRGQGLRVSEMPEPTTDAGRAGLAALLADPGQALLGLDFDGTLAPIVPDPDAARAHPGVPAVLSRLATRGVRVAVVTGRPAATAVAYAGIADVPGLVVLGHYGSERWEGGELTTPGDLAAVDAVRRRLPSLLADAGAPDGTYVEDKGAAVAVHTRRADDPAGALDVLRAPLTELAEELGLVVEPGRFVLELRAEGGDKGDAVRSLVAERPPSVVVFVGDDLGDLAAYDAVDRLRADGTPGLLVCSGSTEVTAVAERADLVVDGPDGVVALLTEIVDTLDR